MVYRDTLAGDLDTMRVYWRTSAAPRSETWRFTWDGLGRGRGGGSSTTRSTR
ncbi:MAG: hypothetical protein SFU57_05240 [Gemmatimonadales bacterium]|nr:hypothetical protein [Gemmatimonadales bacterium]